MTQPDSQRNGGGVPTPLKSKKRHSRLYAAIAGFVMFAVSAPCVVGMIHDVVVGTDNLEGALVAGSFFALTGIAGVVLMVVGLRKPHTPPFAVTSEIERQVLAMAHESHGRITVADLALRTDLSIDESEIVLKYFQSRDVARALVADNGELVYTFGSFGDDFRPQEAIDPLDDEAIFDAELEQANEAVEAAATAKQDS